jgi:DNA polymerase III subunit beta
MNIECVKDKFLDAVQKIDKITGKNLSLPILSCVSLEAKGGEILLKATNLDMGIEISFPAKVIVPGKVAIPNNVLLQFLSNLSTNEKISLQVADGMAHITTKNISTKIKTQPHEEFPIIPKVTDGTAFEIEPEGFVSGLRSVWYSSAVSSMKPELASVYIYHSDDSLVFVATDSFRLAEKRIKAKKIKDFGNILIPFKNVSEIIRVLESAHEPVEVVINQNQISFSWNGAYLVSRIIDGVFPDYKQIIPKDPKTEAVVLKEDCIQALKRANVFSDTFHQVTFHIDPKEKIFEVSTRNNDVGENREQIDGVLKGESVSISFNYKYLSDCFQSINIDSLSLSFEGLGRPLVIKGVSDSSFLYLVMPMNK